MSANDSYIGQLDLLMLPQSRMQVIDNEECIVIPRHANPSIYMPQTQSGQRKALLDLFVRATQNNQYGNTHFVKANVGKTDREKYGISKDDLGQYSPILGNLRPYAGTSRPVADDDDLPEAEPVKAGLMQVTVTETPATSSEHIQVSRELLQTLCLDQGLYSDCTSPF